MIVLPTEREEGSHYDVVMAELEATLEADALKVRRWILGAAQQGHAADALVFARWLDKHEGRRSRAERGGK